MSTLLADERFADKGGDERQRRVEECRRLKSTPPVYRLSGGWNLRIQTDNFRHGRIRVLFFGYFSSLMDESSPEAPTFSPRVQLQAHISCHGVLSTTAKLFLVKIS